MKVLIISHNPVSEQSSMGKTFLSLFSQFDSRQLCQLYIYPTIPSGKHCGSYYRVTDKEAVKGAFLRSRIGGEISEERISGDQAAYEHAGDESLYRNRKNKSATRRLLRDVVWKLAPWYNRGLREWLDKQQPTCIFVAPGVAEFIYDFSLRISRERGIPIVTYVCDEYYFVREPESPVDKLRLKRLRGKIDRLMAKTERLVVISQELNGEYSAHFGVNTRTLMTGSAFTPLEQVPRRDAPGAISYFGNVRSNRYISLGQIGSALDDLNRELGTNYRLKIYTSEKDRGILDHLTQFQSVQMCGFVTGKAFETALRGADVLVHVEAFDDESIDKVRHSVSTKIADSLASGVPLLAYGPEEVSSMKHLLRHDCAITATSARQLTEALRKAFTNEEARRGAVENALKTAREYHDSQRNSRELEGILRLLSKEQ